MLTYVFKCEGCGGNRPFPVPEAEASGVGNQPIRKHCPTCRTMTNWMVAFSERRLGQDRRMGVEIDGRDIPRKHPRVRLVTQVESRASRAVSLGRTDNISVGGALVLSRDTFDRETAVIIRFTLPGGRPVEAQGRVAHAVRGVNMGIQFTQLNEADEKAIKEFVQEAGK